MIKRGIATFTLDSGQCPRWLFERMVRLGGRVTEVIADEYGPEEFVRRLADPAWFQALGTVLAFDWNASGLTTILTAAIKESLRGRERHLGIFACGGKGKTSLRTPSEISGWGEKLALPEKRVRGLAYNSRLAAKVDSALVQDGFQVYHHAFFFTRGGAWTVVQQGMNREKQTARRYHWHSDALVDPVCEPHTGIASPLRVPTLDLTARRSAANRELSTDLVRSSTFPALMKDIRVLRRHQGPHSRALAVQSGQAQLAFLELEPVEFRHHPVVNEDFSKSRYLEKILARLCERRPADYERLLTHPGVGPKTIRALSLVAEVIYGAEPSYTDPARYSFAHGGKDGTPRPVDRATYDRTIDFFERVVRRMKAPPSEKQAIMRRLR